jgi:ribosomal protein S18 acetylase RimI-like enzyme
MFCLPALAARIDRAEGRLSASIARNTPEGAPGLGPLVLEVAGGYAVFAAPESPANKMIGVGFAGAADEDALDAVEQAFALRGARLQAEVSTLADPDWHGRLCARGYVPGGFENLLGHPVTSGLQPLPAGVVVEAIDASGRGELVDVLVEGWTHPDAGGVGGDAIPPAAELRRWMQMTMDVPGFCGYVARMGADVVGGASLRIDDGVAQFCGATTLPRFRHRGVQTALLRARLADAARQGCDVAVVTTQPASRSQKNVQREGFALLYARQLLVKSAGR